MSLEPIYFRTKHTLSFQDLDPYGHMNTIVYADYFIRHRFLGMKNILKLDLKAISNFNFAFYTKNIAINFYIPILGDENFEISSFVSEKGENYCLIKMEMRNEKGKLAATCKLHLVCISKDNYRPTAWDENFISKFYENSKE